MPASKKKKVSPKRKKTENQRQSIVLVAGIALVVLGAAAFHFLGRKDYTFKVVDIRPIQTPRLQRDEVSLPDMRDKEVTPEEAAESPVRVDSIQAEMNTAKEYRSQAIYPPYSSPILSVESDPVPKPYQVYPNQVEIELNREDADDHLQKEIWLLSVWSQKVDFNSYEPVVLFAKMEDSNGKSVSADFHMSVLSPGGKEVIIPDLKFDKAREGESIYRVEFKIPEGTDGAYTSIIEAHSKLLNKTVKANVGFNISSPLVVLTHHFRDRIESGSLLIEAEVNVKKKGRFHLRGSLYKGEENPIVEAENAVDLLEGVHWIPLTFYGLAIRKSGWEGPYLLKYLALSRVDTMPAMRAELVNHGYSTSVYHSHQFTKQEFQDPDKIKMAEQIERDVRSRQNHREK